MNLRSVEVLLVLALASTSSPFRFPFSLGEALSVHFPFPFPFQNLKRKTDPWYFLLVRVIPTESSNDLKRGTRLYTDPGDSTVTP